MRAAKVQASLRIRAVSPEPPLLAHTSSESSGTFRQKDRSLAPLNGRACAVKICHDGMLEDTNSLDGVHLLMLSVQTNTLVSFFLYSMVTGKYLIKSATIQCVHIPVEDQGKCAYATVIPVTQNLSTKCLTLLNAVVNCVIQTLQVVKI